MRGFLLAALLAAGASASVLRQEPNGTDGSGGLPTKNNMVVVNEPKWPMLSPSQALDALVAKAKATPSAVKLMPGVSVPNDIMKLVESAAGNETSKSQKLNDGNINVAAAGTCSNIQTHYEWRSLSTAHKAQYVAAMKCLFSKPPRTRLPGVRNRWDDLVAVHQNMAEIIHNVGQFMPWHRYFLKILESEMRNTCGYTGPMTWWDETRDAGDFNGAPMMTEQYFGHMPDGNRVCIISGVFKNTECHIGPGYTNQLHCLSRGVNERTSSSITTTFVNTCLSNNDYNTMQNCFFFGPHAYGHNAVGGDMADVDASPNDPVFFLHHGFVDRAWRIWQRTSPSARTYAIGGYTRQNCGSSCQPTTLDYQLTSYGFYPAVSVRDVMDTTGPYLCYKYDY